MNIYITFDYELFFGANSGTVEKSIIYPTNRLISIAKKYNAKFTFFVDSGMLIKMQEYKDKYKELNSDYEKLVMQIQQLNKLGHSIQLHIHSHWEDSFYDGKKWIFDLSRYRLHQFSSEEIDDIVYRYKKVLTDLVGDKITTYRAGGWCLQPFEKLKSSLIKNNILIDSTVFYGGKNLSATHYFDFTNASKNDQWRFDSDPLKEIENGTFTEIAISSIKLSPIFFWKFAFSKKVYGTNHKIFGDGTPVGASKKDIIKMLLKSTYACVSCDGYKSSLLQNILKEYKKEKRKNLVIIGHPKAQNEYSLNNIEKFLKNKEEFSTL